MEPLQELFQYMQGQGYLPKEADYNDFSQKFEADEDMRSRLYDFLRQRNVVETDYNTFVERHTPKKKVELYSQPSLQEQKPGSKLSQKPGPSIGNDDPMGAMDFRTGQVPEANVTAPPTQTENPWDITTPATGQIPEKKIEVAGTPFLWGNEDIMELGENIRKQEQPDYDTKLSRDKRMDTRMINRDLQTIELVGSKARAQADAADQFLKMDFGDNWVDNYINDVGLANNGDHDAQARLKELNDNHYFQAWYGAQTILERSSNAYDARAKSLEPYQALQQLSDDLNSKWTGGITTPIQWVISKGTQTLGAALMAPKSIVDANIRAYGLSGVADVFEPQRIAVDALSQWGDDLIEMERRVNPKPSVLQGSMRERVAPYKDMKVVVDDNGNPLFARDSEGYMVDLSANDRAEFVKSGAAKNAIKEFSGYRFVDQVANTTADLFIMRYLGGGTAVGTSMVAFTQQQAGLYQQAMDEYGLTADQASEYAFTAAAIQGVAESAIGNFETNIFKTGAARLGVSEVKSLVGKMGPGAAAWQIAKEGLKDIGAENVEELFGNLAQETVRANFQAKTGASLGGKMTADDVVDTMMLTTLVTAGPSALSANYKMSAHQMEAARLAGENPELFQNYLNDLREQGAIDDESAEKMIQRANAVSAMLQRQDVQAMPEQRRTEIAAKAWNAEAVRQYQATAPEVEQPIVKETMAAAQTELNSAVLSPAPETEQAQSAPEVPTIESEGRQEMPTAEDIFGPEKQFQAKQYIPDDMRQHPPTTAVQDAYNSEAKVSEVSNNPGFEDEIVDAIATKVEKDYPVSENDISGLKQYVAGNISDFSSETVKNAVDTLANEYGTQMKRAGMALVERAPEETPEDTIADFFHRGGKVSTESFKRHSDPNFLKDRSVSTLYVAKHGQPIDQLAMTIADKYGITEDEAITRIVNFMSAYPKKNTADYLRQRIAEFEAAEIRRARISEVKTLAEQDMDDDEARSVFGSIDDQIANDIIDTAETETETISQDVAAEINTFLEKYKTTSGNLDLNRLETDFKEQEEGFNPDFLELSHEAYSAIKQLVYGQSNETVGTTTIETTQSAEVSSSETQFDENKGADSAVGEIQKVAGERERIAEAIASAPMPEKADQLLLNTMVDHGLLDIEEHRLFSDMLESGGLTDDIQTEIIARAEQLKNLNVPGKAQYEIALADHATSVTKTGYDPTKPVVSINGDEVVVFNADAEALRAAGFTQPTALYWHYKGPDAQQKITAAMAATKSIATQTDATPGFGTRIRKIFGPRFLHISRMERQIAEAKNFNDAIGHAKRYIGRRPQRIAKVIANLEKITGIPISSDQTEWDNALNEAGIPLGADQPMGMVLNGKVYINPNKISGEAAVHEIGHLWLSAIRGTELYEKGIELVRNSEYFEQVSASPEYSLLSEQDKLEEALAHAIGERGARLYDGDTFESFKEWLRLMWSKISQMFGADMQDWTVNEFADYAYYAITGGKTDIAKREFDKNTKFLFGGKGSAIASVDLSTRFFKARHQDKTGVPAEEIYLATGFFRGVDGRWRYHIPDVGANLTTDFLTEPDGHRSTLGEVLNHPDFFQRYPQLANTPVIVDLKLQSSGEAAFGEIRINPSLSQNHLGTILHEAQHLIQDTEGMDFSTSSIAAMMGLSEIATDSPDLYEKITNICRIDPYWILGAEVEARLVEQTANMEAIPNIPTTIGDIPAENQLTLLNDFQMRQSIIGADLEKYPHKRAAFLWASNRITDEATLKAIRGIVKGEVKRNGTITEKQIKRIKKELGVSTETVTRILAEERTSVNNRTTVSWGEAASTQTWIDKVKTLAKEWLRPRGLFNDELWEMNHKRQGEARAEFHSVATAFSGLQRTVSAHLKQQKAGKIDEENLWQHIQNVMEGEMDILTLPIQIRPSVSLVRNKINSLSKRLILSGAVSGEIVFKIAAGAGIDISFLTDDQRRALKVAFAKRPADRTTIEQDMLSEFLDQHQARFGNYLYRSYKKHDDPNWASKVSMADLNRARMFMEGILEKKMNEVADLLKFKQQPIDAMINEAKDKIEKERIIISDKVVQAEAHLADIQQKQAAYIAQKGIPNKKLGQQYVAAARRLNAIKKIFSDAETFAALPEIDFLNAIEAPGFDANALNIYLRRIYSAKKKVAEMEAKRILSARVTAIDLQKLIDRYHNLDAELWSYATPDQTPDAWLKTGKLGAKDVQVLTGQRKDIPEPIRNLMGEYRDPRVNVLKTAWRLAHTTANAEFLNEAYQAGKGKWLFPPDQKNGPYFTPISSEGSLAMSPIAGWVTTPDIARVFNEYNSRPVIGGWLKPFLRLVAIVKAGKTIASPETHARNFIGNLFFVTNHGWFTSDIRKSILAWKEAFNTQGNSAQEAYIEKCIRLGVIDEGANFGDIKETIEYGFQQYSPDDIRGITESVSNPIKRSFKWMGDTAKSLYKFEDTFYRIWGFEAEKSRYAKAWFNSKLQDLDPQQLSLVEAKAAQNIDMLMPTYSNVPKIIKELRLFPFTGTFVAFPAEMMRVTLNTFAITKEEFRDPRTRDIAYGRIMTMMLANIGFVTMIRMLSALVFGVSDEEDNNIRQFLKPWQKYGTLLFLGKDGSQYRFWNTSYTNPYSWWQSPLEAIFFADEGNSITERIGTGIQKLVDPFTSPELTFSTIAQLALNQNWQSGNKDIYPEVLGRFNKDALLRQWEFARKRIQPGFLKSVIDMQEAYQGKVDAYGNIKFTEDVAMKILTGIQIENCNPGISFQKQLYVAASDKRTARNIYITERKRLLDELSRDQNAGLSESKLQAKRIKSKEQLDYTYNVAQEAYNEVIFELQRQVEALTTYFGVSESQLSSDLKERDFSSEEISIILGGGTPPKLIFK